MAPEAHTGKLEGSFSSLLDSGEYFDLEVHCGKKVYKVHKAIVCPQSNFFRLAVKGKNGFQGVNSGIITLYGASHIVVKSMMRYLYHGKYPSRTPLLGKTPFNHIMYHVKVYGAAEIYQIPGLKKAALENLKFETRFGLWAKEAIGDDFVSFVDEFYSVTAISGDQLRAYVLGKVAKDFDAVHAGKGLSQALHDNPQFAEDLLITLNEQRMADQKLMSELVPKLHIERANCKNNTDPKFKDILRMGDLRCDSYDQEHEYLVWSLPEIRGDE